MHRPEITSLQSCLWWWVKFKERDLMINSSYYISDLTTRLGGDMTWPLPTFFGCITPADLTLTGVWKWGAWLVGLHCPCVTCWTPGNRVLPTTALAIHRQTRLQDLVKRDKVYKRLQDSESNVRSTWIQEYAISCNSIFFGRHVSSKSLAIV